MTEKPAHYTNYLKLGVLIVISQITFASICNYLNIFSCFKTNCSKFRHSSAANTLNSDDPIKCCPTLKTCRIRVDSGSSEWISLYNSLAMQQSSRFSPMNPCTESAGHMPLPQAIPEDNRRFWLQNQWLTSWGSAPAQLVRVWRAITNAGCFQVSGSRCWLSLPVTGSLETKVLQLLLYWLSLIVKKVSMDCKFWAVTSHRQRIFFSCEMKCSMEFVRTCCQPKHSSPCSILRLRIDFWVK